MGEARIGYVFPLGVRLKYCLAIHCLCFMVLVSGSADALDAEEQNFITLINNYRQQNGLGALSISAKLTRAAAWHSEDMASNNHFSHTGTLGRDGNRARLQC